MKHLGTPQYIIWLTYLDCKKRSKKNINIPRKEPYFTDDEKLVRFMLENSSVIERDNERSYSKVADAINIICKLLCPGQWCTRSHCINYSRRSAYNCMKTRPTVCKEYKDYVEKKKQRKIKQEGGSK